jgi:uncharacterized protein with NAD-binding domain and iron-sulfur cluster
MEKKKIVPKTKLNALKQEELLKQLQQNTDIAVNLQQSTVSTVNEPKPIVEKIDGQKVQAEKKVTSITTTQTKDIVSSKSVNLQQDTEKPSKIQRITVDMPLDLYEQMKDEVDDNGQTIKGFVVNLVKAHFRK